MKVEQNRWTAAKGWELGPLGQLGDSAQLVLLFGSTEILKEKKELEAIKTAYGNAHLFGCSTAGEICGTQVTDDSLVATAVHFEFSELRGAEVRLSEVENSFQAGYRLAGALDKERLVHVFVLSDGVEVNGSDLVKGLVNGLPQGITVTGGLSGDGANFKKTYVFWKGQPESGVVAALGLYGERLKVGYGSLGGWDPFGPERVITRSEANVLYELDGRSALELYKLYLGDHAKGLPATGLLFPLSLRSKKGETGLVRTILSINEEEGSMTFAGNVPEGDYARLMKANFDRLIDGAVGAARTSYHAIGSSAPELAILISCVGRKMVLQQRIEEEVEGVLDVLGDKTTLTGFYSYGEISPFKPGVSCSLHNQTMTVTTFSER